jgi:hypothetical protein
MNKIIPALSIAAMLALVGCSTPVEASAPAHASASSPVSTPASAPDPGIEDPTAQASEPPIIVNPPAPAGVQPAQAAPAMSVDEVCGVWKQGFKVLNEGSVSAEEAMTPLEEATAAAPPEVRVQSGIALRILWGQILYPRDQPASAETMGYLGALRQACYELTGIDVVEGLEG